MPSDPVIALAMVLICYTSCYTALDLWSTPTRLRVRQWVWGPAAVILSVGILGVHMGIMLAGNPADFSVQPVPLLVSVLLALAAGLALLASAARRGWISLLAGGLGVATAIMLLHFAHHMHHLSLPYGGYWRLAAWGALAGALSVSAIYLTRKALSWPKVTHNTRVALAALFLTGAFTGTTLVQVALLVPTHVVHAQPHALATEDVDNILRIGGLLVVALMGGAVLAERLQARSLLAVQRHTLDLLLLIASDGTMVEASPSAQDILGYRADELTGSKISALMAPEDVASLLLRARESREEKGLPFRQTLRLRHRDGSWRTMEGVGVDQSRDADVGGIVLNLIDVTEQRRTEEAVHRLSRQRELILEYAGEGIVGTGPDGRITFVNQEALRMVDLSEEEVLERRFADVFWIAHPDGTLYAPAEDPVARVLSSGGVVRESDRLLFAMNGLRLPVDYTASAKAEDDQVVGVIVLFVDASPRRGYEREIQRVAERFFSMLDQVGDAVVMEDLNGRVSYINRAGRELLGVEVGHRRDREKSLYGSVTMRDGDGQLLPPNAHVVERVRRTGIPEGKVERIVDLPNGERRYVLLDAGPTFDAQGAVDGAIFTLHDLSERKRGEEELLRARRIESVGLLAGGIAHDFNNILTVMLGNVTLAREELQDESEAAKLLEQVEAACRQATSLTRQLLTFSKGGSPVTQPLTLPKLVEESVGFLLRGSSIKARFDLPAHTWPIEADEGQFSQVLQNLVINAKQAMPNGGTITVRGKNRRIGAKDAVHLKPGDYVCLSVCDEGVGIPPEVADRVFDPYFTTKSSGQGLGLATTWSIVHRHGGHIAVESRPAGGTAFHVYLPRSRRTTAESQVTETKRHIARRILVMDDDPGVLAVALRMLVGFGHIAEGAADGEAAVELCQAALTAGTPYDLAILDLTVSGGMGGSEAAAHLRAVDPMIKLIASSGYSNDAILADHVAFGFDGVLAKPYRLRDMETAIEAALVHDWAQAQETAAGKVSS
jgi:PAS domain S-box-containing protein